MTSLFRWVEGHSVKNKGKKNCMEPELMNDFVDKLADLEYHRAMMNQNFVSMDFPFEN